MAKAKTKKRATVPNRTIRRLLNWERELFEKGFAAEAENVLKLLPATATSKQFLAALWDRVVRQPEYDTLLRHTGKKEKPNDYYVTTPPGYEPPKLDALFDKFFPNSTVPRPWADKQTAARQQLAASQLGTSNALLLAVEALQKELKQQMIKTRNLVRREVRAVRGKSAAAAPEDEEEDEDEEDEDDGQ